MKLTYRCKECGEPILTHNGLVSHIANYHKIQQKDYYDKHLKQEGEGKCLICGKDTEFDNLSTGYKKFCSRKCRDVHLKQTGEEQCFHCEICNCNVVSNSPKSFYTKVQRHLQTHNISSKDYYDKYLKKPGEGICETCGKPTTFNSLFKGYARYCNGSCSFIIKKTQELKQEREFKKERQDEKLKKEEEYKNYIQELKDRVHEFDWEGERNTWAGGTKPKYVDTRNNLLTDNSMTYIDGQEYQAQGQTITMNNENEIDSSDDFDSYNQQFWL